MILVLRALKLGDLLVAVPALRAIRRHWPGRRVVLACPRWLAPLALLTGAVDEVLPLHGLRPLPGSTPAPEVAIDLHYAEGSTRILDAVAPARRIGHEGFGWHGPLWVDDQHERNRWCRLLSLSGIPADPDDLYLDRPTVDSPAPGAALVHPGAAYGSKRWPPERFAEVVRVLAEDGHDVAVTGTAAERELAEAVADRSGARPLVLAGETSLLTTVALIAGAALLVSGDTGVAHLSYALRTPSVVLFGPALIRHWGPPPGPHVALSAVDVRRGEPFADEPDPALLGVGVPQVLAAVQAIGSRGNSPRPVTVNEGSAFVPRWSDKCAYDEKPGILPGTSSFVRNWQGGER